MLACISTSGLAQNRANIKGKVVDSTTKETMEFATVAVLNRKDSSLVSYTTTLKTGEFNLHNLPSAVDLKLVISFVGYSNYRKYFRLEKGETVDLGTIKMGSKNGVLSEVKVHGEAVPIMVKKDTIEFSAEAFKTPPNAVVEDLLKRLPGIQIDMDGTITVNGKTIKKLLIDGKQYFANDPRIASKNLDADMIAKVQIYDDRDDDPDHLIPDAKVDKILNLTLKSAIKKSVGGKLHGGYGTRDRYDAGLLYNMFRDTLQISLIGLSNNLNQTGFSQSDLNSLGGFNRSGNVNTINAGGRGGGSIQTVTSGGVNINTDYGKKLKVNLLYFYSYTNSNYTSTTFRQQFFGDTTLSSPGASQYIDVANQHTISSLVEANPDTTVRIRYAPKVTFSTDAYNAIGTSNSYNNFFPQLNSSFANTDSHSNNFQFQQSFSYYKRLHRKGETLNITHNLNISPGSGLAYAINNFTSYTAVLPSSNLNRLADSYNNNIDASIGVNYRLPFNKKLTGDVQVNGSYNHNNGRLFDYNLDPATGKYTMYIDSLSHNLVRRQGIEYVRPELTFKLTKQINLIVNATVELMQTYNQFNKNIPDINRFNTYVLPNISYQSPKFSASYNQNINQPSINDLLPYTTFSSQLYSSIGNPNLKPTRTHNLNTNYYTNTAETMVSTSIYINGQYVENSVFRETNVNSQGATLAKPVNKTGSYSLTGGGYLSKGFKKIGQWQTRVSTSVYGSNYHSFFQVNNSEGFQNSYSISLNQSLYANWNNKFEINPSYNISPSITSYQNLAYNTVNYVTQNLNVPVTLKWIKHTTIESSYIYRYNPLVAAGFQKSINIFNFSLARQIQYRDRGEIKVSVYDLFDQNVSEYRYASGNSVTDQQQKILKRYFLLTYAYRFTSTTTKK